MSRYRAEAERAEELTVGNVIEKTFQVFGANVLSFLMIALVCWSPAVLFMVWRLSTLGSGADELALFFVRDMALFAFLAVPLSFVAQGAMVYGTVEFLAGHELSFADSLRKGFRSLLRVFGVTLLMGLLILLGALACVVPGVIAAMMFFVAIPVAVVENPGLSESLRRSRDLTEGYKGTLFLAVLVLGFLQGLLGNIPKLLVNPAVSGAGISALKLHLFVGFHLLINLVSSTLSAIIAAVAYAKLREIRDDIDAEDLASIFR